MSDTSATKQNDHPATVDDAPLCIDCRHHELREAKSMCVRSMSVVNGEPVARSCAVMRNEALGNLCGLSGRLFEPHADRIGNI